MLSGPNGSDFIKTDKNQGPDVNISKLHKNFLQQYEPEAIDPESGKFNCTDFNFIRLGLQATHIGEVLLK